MTSVSIPSRTEMKRAGWKAQGTPWLFLTQGSILNILKTEFTQPGTQPDHQLPPSVLQTALMLIRGVTSNASRNPHPSTLIFYPSNLLKRKINSVSLA